MKVLSIDFDYFVDANLKTRNTKFPDGIDELPKDKLKEQWDYSYELYPDISKIGVSDKEYLKCLMALDKFDCDKVLIAESHKEIYDIFKSLDFDESIEVTNIDFHHDNYISGAHKIDCANWVRHLMNDYPNAKIKWIRRSDSEIDSLFGVFPYENTTEFILEDSYDYVFICYSPEWTPPHLRKYYTFLCTIAVGQKVGYNEKE